MDDTATRATAPVASPLRAWCYLVWLSWQRQMRARTMVWIALGLLTFAALFVAFNTALGRWDMRNWRFPNRAAPTVHEWGDPEKWGDPKHWDDPQYRDDPMNMKVALWRHHGLQPQGTFPIDLAVLTVLPMILSPFSLQVEVFVRSVVFVLFLNFLLPLWSLSFATEAVGGDRESNSLIWLLTRPLPRPAIYLGKFVAMLPWSLALNLGGFGVLCLAGGAPGRETFRLLWPSVLCGTLAFSSLFYLFGAFFRRPAIVSIVYTFFLEAILGNMPGYLKRVSLNFYTQCMMYDSLRVHGIDPPRPQVFLPVEGATACAILLGATAALLALGMLWFARKEYHEVS
jgi:ABC-type transport system involved in multi-copper enzyme maturation permease subunit